MASEPAFVPPMLAQPLRMPEEARLLTGDWVFERKLDGLRCVCVRSGGRVELWSRNHLSFTRRFPEIATAVAGIPVDSFVLDGEIAAFDGERTSFELLQSGSPDARRIYVIFDVLFLLGQDTTGIPLRERIDLLRLLLKDPLLIKDTGEHLQLSAQLTGHPVELFEAACASGWEGLVAKRAKSVYREGRSPDWRKLKCLARQEVVVGGWTEPSGSRTGFGSLVTGYYDEPDPEHPEEPARLLYAGRVGTGFDERTLRELLSKLQALETPESPFADLPPLKGVHWVRPELVAEAAFGEWTRDGKMRHPRYLGLRPDKAASEVRREP